MKTEQAARKPGRLNIQARSEARGEEGSMIIMVALTLTIIIGMVGLAMDAGQMYVTKQKAQAAADAAALAGAMDMYNGTYATGSYGAKTTCSTSSNWTPCYYARLNGFGGSASDTVTVDFSPSGSCTVPSGLGSLASDSPNLICVTASRVVNTTLVRVLGTNSSTVSATAKAALALSPATVPIVITHPHLADALQAKGTSTLRICGGPTRSIQVDSDGSIKANGQAAATNEAFSVNSNSIVDLHKAGPSDPGNCSTGTGADFRSWGPAPSGDTFSWLSLGTTGHYVQPGSGIKDPFLSLAEPSKPTATTTQSPTVIAQGKSLGVTGCTAMCTAAGGCQIYKPGAYTGGISVSGSNNLIGYFYPGLYYIIDDSRKQNNVGFQTGSNGDMEMLSTVCSNVANDADTGSGMVVFNAGSASFNVGSNGTASLVGPPVTSTKYEGILFWESRNITAGVAHSFGGGGNMTLQGTIYANMLDANVTYKNYQSVTLQGNSGSNTSITGEIITNVLQLGGSGTIVMNLSSAKIKNVRQVALVQ